MHLHKTTVSIFALLCICLALACSSETNTPNSIALPSYTDYKSIPNISQEEIKAVEALKLSRRELIYGVNLSTEAFVGSDGQVDGFARLFCERLSQLFGINFKPVVYTWDDLVDNLASHEVDFTGELTPTAERLKQYLMTDPIAQRTGKIFFNKYAEKLTEIAQQRPIRCAFLEGSMLYNKVKNSWNLPFVAVFADDVALPGLFEKGEIDAFIDENTLAAIFDNTEMVASEDYFPLIFSPVALASQNPEMAPIISVMQKYLASHGLNEITSLYNQGITGYAKYRLFNFLTEEEKAYIKQHNSEAGAVMVAMESDNYPIAFYNTTDGEFQGIAVDVLQRIEMFTGLKFQIANQPDTTWPDMLDMLERGDISIISELVPSDSRQGRFIWSSTPYSYDNYALLSRADYPDVELNQVLYTRVGLIAESAYGELFHAWFPNSANNTTYVAHEDAFAALERGEIDLLMASQNLLLSLTNYLEKPGFKANIIFKYPFESRFGLNKNQHVLNSIISKAQLYVDTERIGEAWKTRVFDYNSKMLRDIMPYLLLAIGLLVLGFSAAFVLLIKNRRISRNLEDIVAQRTSELLQANRAKSDFLSRMSHEMRTPMNAIIGMTKIAEDTRDVDKLKYCLATISESSRHLLGLINDVLDMSKIEAGKFELDPHVFNIEQTLLRISNLIIDKVRQNQQRFDVIVGQNMHLNYVGDELRLSQVITNLLSNAVKFTPENGHISLKVEEQPGDMPRLRFTVTDTGIGMTEEQIGRLFNAFEQADGSISTRFGGTGLGLAISKNIVEKMNGQIWVESRVQEGSQFIFEVELGLPEHMPQLSLSPEIAAQKLLVVESDPTDQENFRQAATQLGLNYQLAETGSQALKLIEQAKNSGQPFALVLLAYKLADTDAFTLQKQLPPVSGKIMLMASIGQWLEIEARGAQSAYHIFKPIFPASLFDGVNAVFNNSGEASRQARLQGAPPDLSRINLLLAEDIQINQVIFTSLLKKTGINIDVASDGQQALGMFQANPDHYDIIIMDVQMPVMDGYQATMAIRAMDLAKAKTIPIIAMTANAFKEDIDKSLASGMNDHTAKPIDEHELIGKIVQYTGAS